MAVFGERVAVGDVLGVLAFEHHVGTTDRVGLGVEFLTVRLQVGVRVEFAQVLLGNRQHAASAASRVENGFGDAGLGEQIVVFDEQQVHHQPDDLAWGEVLACGFVGKLGEPADQFLVQVTHL